MTTVEDERVEDRKSLMAGWPRWVGPALGIVIFLLVAAPLGSIGGKLSDVQRNDSASYLPEGAEATAALAASKRFTGLESTPAIIIYTRPSGITEADRIQLTLVTLAIAEHLNTRLAGPPRGPVVSDDGKAAQIIVPFAGCGSAPLRCRTSRCTSPVRPARSPTWSTCSARSTAYCCSSPPRWSC